MGMMEDNKSRCVWGGHPEVDFTNERTSCSSVAGDVDQLRGPTATGIKSPLDTVFKTKSVFSFQQNVQTESQKVAT